jgi:hypothetical protein
MADGKIQKLPILPICSWIGVNKIEVALKYYNILKQKLEINSYDICLEPSAGQGAFYKLMPTQMREGVDLDPKYPGVVQMNFFDYKPKSNKKYLNNLTVTS